MGESIFDMQEANEQQQQANQGMAAGGNAFRLQNLAQNLQQLGIGDSGAGVNQPNLNLALVPTNRQAADLQVAQGLIHGHHQQPPTISHQAQQPHTVAIQHQQPHQMGVQHQQAQAMGVNTQQQQQSMSVHAQ